MIRIDFTTGAITVEPDGNYDQFLTIRALSKEGVQAEVTRRNEPEGPAVALEAPVRTRSGGVILHEYDIREPGIYHVESARRDHPERRSVNLIVSFLSNELMRVTVQADSSPATWVIEDTLHEHRFGDSFFFDTRITGGDGVVGGEVTRIESDQAGVKFQRQTSWEKLMADDDVDSV